MEEENKHIDELIANYLTEGLDKNALDELKHGLPHRLKISNILSVSGRSGFQL
jgi:beta-xylosidase